MEGRWLSRVGGPLCCSRGGALPLLLLHHYQRALGLAGQAAANFLPPRPVHRRPCPPPPQPRAHLGLCLPSGSLAGGAGARGRPPSRSKLCSLLSVDERRQQRCREVAAAAAAGRSAARAGGVGSSHVCQAVVAAAATLTRLSPTDHLGFSPGPWLGVSILAAANPVCLQPGRRASGHTRLCQLARGLRTVAAKGSGAGWARGAALL